ncbi:hypothetical protein EX30DRAFT_375652 [Ascodesmis nigricans]|uniref:Uncharacterized protein n=1 Tax=Ascodesmis nigricans TaxID=341454 RepID=A0A4S2MP12_9PEZI|nr:hypothetical protein EX30DRAFT_375652 [Ascodesmis nigricans]
MPVNPYEYNTRPVRNLYPNIHYGDSITSMLSQENYLSPSSSFSGSPEPEPMISDDGCSSGCSSPTWGYPVYRCSFPNCAYSIIGFRSPMELDLHLSEGQHYAPQEQHSGEPSVFGWTKMRDPAVAMLPEITPFDDANASLEQQQSCPCPYCVPRTSYYNQDWQMYQPAPVHPGMAGYQMPMPMPPTIIGYNGPEVENLVWSEGERRPEGYQAAKRQRMGY